MFDCEKEMIRSVFVNLLNNAVKFTNPNGTVSFSLGSDNENISVVVRDTGIGIPQKHHGKIFEKFYRVPRPDMHIPGTGLGLAIVNEIVKKYGGEITVQSEEGKGSTFTVIFPIQCCIGKTKKIKHQKSKTAGKKLANKSR